MGRMIGADPQQLESAASQLRAAADELDSYTTGLTSALGGVLWLGQVAGQFLGAWSGSHRPRMTSTASFIRDAATVLDRNAAEQRAASDSNGSLAAPLICEIPDTFAHQAYGSSPQPIDRDLAEMADFNTRTPSGWTRMTADELRDVGIDPSRLSSSWGLEARIYRDEAGRYVLAFKGTDHDQLGDWATNLNQATGLTDGQYNEALRLAKRAKAAFGDELVITGHSLGGGLASYTSLATGSPAVTFNAAGLHDNSMRSLGLDPDVARDLAEAGQIRSYRVKGEILTYNQEHHFVNRYALPDALGSKIEITDPTSSRLRHKQHGMDSVKEAMDHEFGFGGSDSRSTGSGAGGGGGGSGR